VFCAANQHARRIFLSAVRNSPVPAFRAAHPGRHHFMFLYDRRRVWQSETRQKKNARVEAPSRALDNRHRALSLAALHTLSPMPPITAPVAKPIYHQDSNGLCAELAILDKTTFPARELHVPLSSIGEFSCCGLMRLRPTFCVSTTECAPSG
jgi:hypothetical protein